MDDPDANTWDIDDAKDVLRELRVRANTYGPQVLTIGGMEAAAVISVRDLRRLQGVEPSFKDLLLSFPSLEGIDLTRDPTPPRDIDLG